MFKHYVSNHVQLMMNYFTLGKGIMIELPGWSLCCELLQSQKPVRARIGWEQKEAQHNKLVPTIVSSG